MFPIPTTRVTPTTINPDILCLYGPRKAGKTTLAAMWPPGSDGAAPLHIDTARGTRYVPARSVACPDLRTFIGDPFAGFDQRNRADRDQAKADSHRSSLVFALQQDPVSRLVLDMVNDLESWCEDWATAEYKSGLQGKDFEGSTVLALPKGLGYALIRQKFEILWRHLLRCVRPDGEILLLCHQRDAKMEKTAQVSESEDLDMTGKLRRILASHCAAIGYLWRTPENHVKVTFQTRNSDAMVGCRVPRLEGNTYVLSWLDPASGCYAHGWEQIYLPTDGTPPQFRLSDVRKSVQIPIAPPPVEQTGNDAGSAQQQQQ